MESKPASVTMSFQSTLPRGERRPVAVVVEALVAVSIHAPARGATSRGKEVRRSCGVSIHAPARGATMERFLTTLWELVSIHAPARGATTSPTRRRSGKRCFNPRSRAGSDVRGDRVGPPQGKFQSTLPRGERPVTRASPQRSCTVFQSTLPRGERQAANAPPRCQTSSFQSTLPRGERRRVPGPDGVHGRVSIHAPARGAT